MTTIQQLIRDLGTLRVLASIAQVPQADLDRLRDAQRLVIQATRSVPRRVS